MIKVKKAPNDRPNDDGVWFDYALKPGDPTPAQLHRKPDWGWLDSLCGEGYHCVQYQLVNRK